MFDYLCLNVYCFTGVYFMVELDNFASSCVLFLNVGNTAYRQTMLVIFLLAGTALLLNMYIVFIIYLHISWRITNKN